MLVLLSIHRVAARGLQVPATAIFLHLLDIARTSKSVTDGHPNMDARMVCSSC